MGNWLGRRGGPICLGLGGTEQARAPGPTSAPTGSLKALQATARPPCPPLPSPAPLGTGPGKGPRQVQRAQRHVPGPTLSVITGPIGTISSPSSPADGGKRGQEVQQPPALGGPAGLGSASQAASRPRPRAFPNPPNPVPPGRGTRLYSSCPHTVLRIRSVPRTRVWCVRLQGKLTQLVQGDSISLQRALFPYVQARGPRGTKGPLPSPLAGVLTQLKHGNGGLPPLRAPLPHVPGAPCTLTLPAAAEHPHPRPLPPQASPQTTPLGLPVIGKGNSVNRSARLCRPVLSQSVCILERTCICPSQSFLPGGETEAWRG